MLSGWQWKRILRRLPRRRCYPYETFNCFGQRPLRNAEAPVYGITPIGDTRRRSRGRARAPADRARGRRAESHQPADGMSLPSPLPPRRLGEMRCGGSAARPLWRRPRSRLLVPAPGLAAHDCGDEARRGTDRFRRERSIVTEGRTPAMQRTSHAAGGRALPCADSHLCNMIESHV